MALWPVYMLGAMIGAVLGSFIGVVACRWPRGESFIAGRSHCQSCGGALRAWHMIPLVSYCVLRGRCAMCGARLPVDLIVAELGGVAAVMLGISAGETVPELIAWSVFGLSLVLLALLDARHYWLPDALTLPLIALGLAIGLILPEADLVQRLAGALCGYGSLTLVRLGYRYWRRHEGLGGGDPKLFAAIGAWLGVAALPAVLLGATLLALGHALVLRLRGNPITAQTALPLGSPLAVAALIAMIWA